MIKLKVKEVAEEKGWNANMLTRATRLSTRAIYSIWNGNTNDPGVQTLGAIARVLGVDLCDILEEDGVELPVGPGVTDKSEDGPEWEELSTSSPTAGPSSVGYRPSPVLA